MRLIPFILLLISSYTYAKPTIVVVVDTGFGFTQDSLNEKHLCKYGHKDFTSQQKYLRLDTVDKVPNDDYGHGTNIVGLIDKYADNANYCMVIIKAFSKDSTDSENIVNSEKALEYATKLKPDVINYSAGGSSFDSVEYDEIKSYLDNGGIFVAAAGNESKELGDNYHYFPAMYDPRIIIVGNSVEEGIPNHSSNYGGLVTEWENGTNVNSFGLIMTGSSQSTAIATGKIVNNLKRINGK